MAIMACHGLIKPMPQCAIFADTGDEPEEVYRWLKELCRRLTFPVIQLRLEPKLSDMLVNEWGHSQIPSFFRNEKGQVAIGRRQCTKYGKILPVRRELRQRYGKQDITLWMGISTDEVSRAKDSGRQWLTHRFPLLENRQSRRDCEAFLKTQTSWKVPKSACVYCPYKDRKRWAATARNKSEMVLIRKVEAVLNPRGEFLTVDMKPIDHIDFSTDADRRQGEMFGNQFNNECEGMCGV